MNHRTRPSLHVTKEYTMSCNCRYQWKPLVDKRDITCSYNSALLLDQHQRFLLSTPRHHGAECCLAPAFDVVPHTCTYTNISNSLTSLFLQVHPQQSKLLLGWPWCEARAGQGDGKECTEYHRIAEIMPKMHTSKTNKIYEPSHPSSSSGERFIKVSSDLCCKPLLHFHHPAVS